MYEKKKRVQVRKSERSKRNILGKPAKSQNSYRIPLITKAPKSIPSVAIGGEDLREKMDQGQIIREMLGEYHLKSAEDF
jgi:hypothetical protein